MRLSVGQKRFGLLAGIVTSLTLLVGSFVFNPAGALSSTLPNRYVKLSDSVAGHAGLIYELGFDTTVSDTLGSVELEFCTNDPFPGTSCTVPTGLNVSSASLISQTGTNDFSIDAGDTNAHRIVFTRTPSVVGATTFKFEFNNVTNPSSAGSLYGRIRTFDGSNMTGSVTNGAGMAMSIIGDINISTEVPPHIDLCVGITIANDDCTSVAGDSLDFGKLSPSSTATATSQFVSGTNADNGYTVTLSGTTMTSGNNVIPALTTLNTASPGINQFGMNLRKNIQPNKGAEPTGIGSAAPVGNYAIPDNFIFNSGDTIVSAAGPDNYRRFTETYIIDIDSNQPAGFYATSITFVALGNF